MPFRQPSTPLEPHQVKGRRLLSAQRSMDEAMPHSDAESYHSSVADASLNEDDPRAIPSSVARRRTTVRIEDNADLPPIISDPSVSPQRVQRLSMVERRRRAGSLSTSGSTATFRRCSQAHTVEVTKEYMQNLADAHGVSTEHVRDVALAAQGNTDLMLSILQSEVRNRLASSDSVDTLRFNDAAAVTQLLRFLDLPNDWEGEVIRTLNATQGDAQEAAAQLEHKKAELQSAIEATQERMSAEEEAEGGEGTAPALQTETDEGEHAEVYDKASAPSVRDERTRKALDSVVAHVAASGGKRLHHRPHRTEGEPMYYKLNGAVGARGSLLAPIDLASVGPDAPGRAITRSLSPQGYLQLHDHADGADHEHQLHDYPLSSAESMSSSDASAVASSDRRESGETAGHLPSSCSTPRSNTTIFCCDLQRPQSAAQHTSASLGEDFFHHPATPPTMRQRRPSLCRGAVDVSARLAARHELTPSIRTCPHRSARSFHRPSSHEARSRPTRLSTSADWHLHCKSPANTTPASSPQYISLPAFASPQPSPCIEGHDNDERCGNLPLVSPRRHVEPAGRGGGTPQPVADHSFPSLTPPEPFKTGGGPPPPPPPPPGLGRTGGPAAPPPPPGAKGSAGGAAAPIANISKTRPVPINGAIGDAVGVFGEVSHHPPLSAATCANLEDMFKRSDASVRTERAKSKPVVDAILAWNTDTAVNVMLRIINLPIQQIEASIRTFDTLTLGEERVALLNENIPKAEDFEAINRARKAHGGPWSRTEQQELPTAVRFFLMTQSIDHYAERIHAWSLKHKLQDDLEDLEQKLTKANRAIDAVFDSKALPDLLYFLLEVSNFLNKGSRFQDARGFPITQLPQIMDFKTTDGKSTLLSCVAESLRSTESANPASAAMLHISEDLLPAVEEGREIDVASIEQELKKLRGRLQKCKLLIEQLKNDGRWTTVLGKFIIRSLPELERVEKLAETIDGKMERLCTFLCERKETFSLNEVLRTLTMFCKRFDQEQEKMQLRKERCHKAEEAEYAQREGASGLSSPPSRAAACVHR